MRTFEGYVQADYSSENWMILLNAKAEGDTNIDNATSVEDVMLALANAQAAMAAVNTLLDDAKEAAHVSLNAALTGYAQDDYSPENWTVLNGLKEAGDTATDAAADPVEVEAAQSAAVTGMEGVRTIAWILAAAKSAALEALAEAFGNYTESDYTADDWTVLSGFKEAGDTAIDAAADLAGVEAAQSAAVVGMEGVQTIARILAAAKSEAHEALAAAFETDAESGDNADDTESNDTVDEDTESDDTVDETELTDFVTVDPKTDDVTEIEQIEEPPVADAPDYITETEAVHSGIADDAAAASQETTEANDDAPNAAEEKTADLDPALESITLDTKTKRHG